MVSNDLWQLACHVAVLGVLSLASWGGSSLWSNLALTLPNLSNLNVLAAPGHLPLFVGVYAAMLTARLHSRFHLHLQNALGILTSSMDLVLSSRDDSEPTIDLELLLQR